MLEIPLGAGAFAPESLQPAYCALLTAHCPLATAYCSLLTRHCSLLTQTTHAETIAVGWLRARKARRGRPRSAALPGLRRGNSRAPAPARRAATTRGRCAPDRRRLRPRAPRAASGSGCDDRRTRRRRL